MVDSCRGVWLAVAHLVLTASCSGAPTGAPDAPTDALQDGAIQDGFRGDGAETGCRVELVPPSPEIVDANVGGGVAAMDVASDSTVHLVYSPADGPSQVWYARRSSAGWSAPSAIPGFGVRGDVSLLAREGAVDVLTGHMYSTLQDGDWDGTAIEPPYMDEGYDCTTWPRLAHDRTSDQVRGAVCGIGICYMELVPTVSTAWGKERNCSEPDDISLAVDSVGSTHLFNNAINGAATHFFRARGMVEWGSEKLDFARCDLIGVDAVDRLHARCCREPPSCSLYRRDYYAWKGPDDAWLAVPLDWAPGPSKVDDGGRIHVTYPGPDGVLRYGWKDEGLDFEWLDVMALPCDLSQEQLDLVVTEGSLHITYPCMGQRWYVAFRTAGCGD